MSNWVHDSVCMWNKAKWDLYYFLFCLFFVNEANSFLFLFLSFDFALFHLHCLGGWYISELGYFIYVHRSQVKMRRSGQRLPVNNHVQLFAGSGLGSIPAVCHKGMHILRQIWHQRQMKHNEISFACLSFCSSCKITVSVDEKQTETANPIFRLKGLSHVN